MNSAIVNSIGYMVPVRRWILLAICFAGGVLGVNSIVKGQMDGFIQPFREIELASDESGAIFQLHVQEGDYIKASQMVAKLDDRVQQLQVKIAAQLAESTSQLDAAKRTLEKRQQISQRLLLLQKEGHAGESELVRAEMELSIAKAKYASAQESQIVRSIELQRAELDLERRKIRAPFDGIVSEVYRHEGEFLSPLHPEVIQLIQVDKVLATFAIPSHQVAKYKTNQDYRIEIGGQRTVIGRVFKVGVQTDAQSGTVEVQFIVENEDLSIRAGELCTLKS